MKKILPFLTMVLLFAFASNAGNAQCGGVCSGLTTYTQGGWGSAPHGGNPGTILANNFAAVYPSGVTIGCNTGYTFRFTSAAAVQNFLPQGGTPGSINASATNPTGSYTVLAGQVLTATINIDFDKYNPSGYKTNNTALLANLTFKEGVFSGKTVQFVLNEANKVLGGCTSSYSASDLNDALTTVNENYDGGSGNNEGELENEDSTPTVASITGTATICKGSTTTLSDATAGGVWSTSNAAIATVSSGGVVTGVAAGTVTITYSVSNACGIGSSSLSVTVNALPAAPTVSITQPTCAVATGTITVTAPIGSGYTYSIDGTNYQSSTTFTGLASGTYSITAKNGSGCVSSSGTSVTVNAQPATLAAPTVSVTQPTCAVATGTITVTAPTGTGITYSIDGTNYQSSTTFSTVAAGSYSVTAKNSSGCISSVTSATINAQPATPAAPTVSVTQTTCAVATGTITVTAPTGSGYTYSINGTNYQSSATFSNVVAGTYSVTAKNASGCVSSVTSATVNAQPATPAAPTISITQPTCAVATGTIIVTAPTGVGYTYSIDGTNYQPSATFTGLASGTYSVTVKNGSGCISSGTSATVTAQPSGPAAPTVTLTQPTCAVATGTITVTAPTGSGITYSIDGTTYQSSTTFSNVVAGTYSVTAKNASGCVSSVSSTTINSQPSAPAVPTISMTQPTCAVSTGSITITAPTGSGYTYSIDGINYQSSTTFTGLASGTYSVTVKNASGCISSVASATLNTQPATPTAPTVTLTQPTCAVATGTITVTAPTGSGYTYSIDGTNYQSSATFTGLAAGTYSVTVKNGSGCISSVTSAVLNSVSKPADFAYATNSTQALSGNSFSFVVYGNAAGDTYSWDFGDGTSSTSANPTKSYTNFGIYNARLVATNTGGCSDTTYQTVVVTPPSKSLDTIPTCSGTTSTITQTVIFPSSLTDWAGTNLKTQTFAKFDSTLGTLLAVKIINKGSFTTDAKVEVTGNMAAGTKRLVDMRINGTMNFAGPGFLYGIIPPTIIDTFSATGYDGIKDFAGTSGKDFGPVTSAMKDSTIFTAASILASYQGSGSVTLTAFTNTNFSATIPTGNDTLVIRTTAMDTATIVYYYCSGGGEVPGGGGGGLESKSLGDVIAKRMYNKAINNELGATDYAKMQSPVVSSIRPTTFGTGSGSNALTLSDILPKQLQKYNFTSYISTPTDIPSFTNATDVLSIDYTLNNQAKAVSFATQTSGAVYEHTKVICDRLKGSQLISMQDAMINNVKMVTFVLKTAEGNTEYAMSFAIGAKSGRNNYTIQSNWLNKDYVPDETMYNVQLWAVSPEIVTDMASKIISTLQANMPVQYIDGGKLPDTYITSGTRDKTNLVLAITNNQTNTNGYFVVEDRSNELSTSTTSRNIPFTVQANGKASVSIPMNDNYESTISMYINNQLQDVVYMADGTWSYAAGPSSTVNNFKVTNDANKTYSSDELPVFRNVEINGNSSDFVSIFKLLKGGGIAQDVSGYKTLKFTASGGYNLRVTLVKNSITNWADQYNTLIPLDNGTKDYSLPLSSFKSASIKDNINANDVTTVVFSVEVGNGRSNTLNTTLSNISFSKQDVAYLQSLSAKEVQVYPNPVIGNNFTCSFMSDKQTSLNLRVIDVESGRVVTTQQVNAVAGQNTVQVSINRVSGSSVYMVALDNNEVQYKKVKVISGTR